MKLNATLVTTLASGLLMSSAIAQPQQSPGVSFARAAANQDYPVRAGGSVAMGSSDCTVIDFEGVGDLAPVGMILGPIDVTFGASWLGLVDADVGGSGNFANEPSPDTVAFFQNPGEPIDFSEGVNYIEITYVASAQSLPVILTAYDGPGGTGNVVGVAMGTTLGNSADGAPCTGDPGGSFCLWDNISVQAATNSILSITVAGTANQFAFDNMTFCRDTVSNNYCLSLPNTTGLVSGLVAAGSDVAMDNNLTLTAFNLPLNQTGYVLNSMNPGTTPVGSGVLCLGAGKGRHTSQIGNSGATGVIVTALDLSALPRSAGGPATVMAGETWYFQLWHRDGMDSNFTDGVEILFQ